MTGTDLAGMWSGPRVDDDDPTIRKILDAALDETAAQGLHGLTIEGVARRCRLNRATIYRQIGGREAVQAALLQRESERLVRVMGGAVAELRDPSEMLIEGFVTAMRFAREHPVIQRLVRYEPGAFVEAGSAHDFALLKMGITVMSETMRAAQRKGFANHLDAGRAGEVLARLFSSLVMLPGGSDPLDDDDTVRRFARDTLVPMLRGPQPKRRGGR